MLTTGLVVAIAACADEPATDATPTDAAHEVSGDATFDAQVAVPVLDPMLGPAAGLFDCHAKGTPKDRVATVPSGCVLDPKCTDDLVVGHRGAGGQFAQIAPENSLSAIRAAIVMGQDGVELDVRHTADDKLVVMHDSTLDRTTDANGAVDKMTLAQLQQVKLKNTNEAGETYKGDFACERVPSLADALALTKDRLFVDLDTKTGRIDLVVAAIVKAEVIDQVFVSVSDPKQAAKARKLNPGIRVQVRPDTPAELEAALALFPDRPPEVIEVPSASVAKLAPGAHAVGAKVFSNSWGVDALQKAVGPQTTAYTALYDKGTDIVQTEYPAALLIALGRALKSQ